MIPRRPYSGDCRRLVIAIDVGTTYSGVSYSVLNPGIPPVITSVKRYPGQGEASGDSKIPSLIVYGPNGDIRAIGAEAEEESFKDQIEEENLVVARWFKLHLRPKHLHTSQSFDGIPPLPLGKSAIRVLADFLAYLFKCAKDYIIESAGFNGQQIWSSEKDIILSHPNGWEGAQQDLMRRAAVIAGIVPDTPKGRESIRFVTEGEASLHYCVSNGIVPKKLKARDPVLVVDAGGGTIDISGYKKKTNKGLLFEEAAAPQCFFQGSIFVTQQARTFLKDFLIGSKYHDAIDPIAECFDKDAKLRFRDANGPCFIRFGSIFEKDPKYDIQSGRLKLDGSQVAEFFEPAIGCIVEAIEEAKSTRQIKSVFLVGGFAASDWLFHSLKTRFENGPAICRPDQNPGKAVADGAISFYLDHFVDTRISKYTFGTDGSTQYNPEDSDHFRRRATVYRDHDGEDLVPGHFFMMLPKGTRVSETQEFRSPFILNRASITGMNFQCDILQYRGPLSEPKWITDGSPEEWAVVRAIIVDSSSMSKIAALRWNFDTGKRYYRAEYEVVLLFGLTEFKAKVCWKENGKEKEISVPIIYPEGD